VKLNSHAARVLGPRLPAPIAPELLFRDAIPPGSQAVTDAIYVRNLEAQVADRTGRFRIDLLLPEHLQEVVVTDTEVKTDGLTALGEIEDLLAT
jgi:hypothetical protein